MKHISTAAVARIAARPGTCGYERALAMVDSALKGSVEMAALRTEVARLQDKVARLEAENMLLVGRLASAAP